MAMGRVGSYWFWGPHSSPECSRGYSPLPCSRRKAGTWPQKALLHQKLPELLISSVAPDVPRAVLQPARAMAPLG